MQGNDLGQSYGHRNVVILEPLLFEPPQETLRMKLGKKINGSEAWWDRYAATWTLNDKMCAWVRWFGREYSVGIEVWSFLEDEELFDRLQIQVDKICGDYVLGWERWGNLHDAYVRLQASPEVMSVYDGDRERVERYWHFRGVSVLVGDAP